FLFKCALVSETRILPVATSDTSRKKNDSDHHRGPSPSIYLHHKYGYQPWRIDVSHRQTSTQTSCHSKFKSQIDLSRGWVPLASQTEKLLTESPSAASNE